MSRKLGDFRHVPHLARVRVLPQPWEATSVCTPDHTQQASQTSIAIRDLGGVMRRQVWQSPREAAAANCPRAIPRTGKSATRRGGHDSNHPAAPNGMQQLPPHIPVAEIAIRAQGDLPLSSIKSQDSHGLGNTAAAREKVCDEGAVHSSGAAGDASPPRSCASSCLAQVSK